MATKAVKAPKLAEQGSIDLPTDVFAERFHEALVYECDEQGLEPVPGDPSASLENDSGREQPVVVPVEGVGQFGDALPAFGTGR